MGTSGGVRLCYTKGNPGSGSEHMADKWRGHELLRQRDRALEGEPGFRRAFDQYLKDFQNYKQHMEGDSPTRQGRKAAQGGAYGRRGFRA